MSDSSSKSQMLLQFTAASLDVNQAASTVVLHSGARTLAGNEQMQTPKFGGFCPYWAKIGSEVLTADSAEQLLTLVPRDQRRIDASAVMELLLFNYMLGDRTVVEEVRRMPWRATLTPDGSVHRRAAIPHKNHVAGPTEIAELLYDALREELFEVASKAKRVYLLLSGGYDSRIVAAVLKTLEPEIGARVTCVTWGEDSTRDVEYARRIASFYDWPFVHIAYDAEMMWENVNRAAVWGGSEVAGVHLHGMDWFRTLNSDDLIVAASFGDSIGRGEYSSIHVSKLVRRPLSNPYGLIRPSLMEELARLAEADRATAWDMCEGQPSWVLNELDMQENYMRRMICHAMDYIRQFATLHQAFTSEEVVSLMWSFSPECRTNQVYYEMFKRLDTRLCSLPWARTGVAPDGTREDDSSLRQRYHRWTSWARHELRERLETLLFSCGLQELELFDQNAIKRCWDCFVREPDDTVGHTETVLKLCSLELSRRHFGLLPGTSFRHWRHKLAMLAPKWLGRHKREGQ